MWDCALETHLTNQPNVIIFVGPLAVDSSDQPSTKFHHTMGLFAVDSSINQNNDNETNYRKTHLINLQQPNFMFVSLFAVRCRLYLIVRLGRRIHKNICMFMFVGLVVRHSSNQHPANQPQPNIIIFVGPFAVDDLTTSQHVNQSSHNGLHHICGTVSSRLI